MVQALLAMAPPELLKLAVELMNYAMFAGAMLIKFPQIIAIVRTRKVVGMSESSLTTEFLACVSFCLYNQLMGHPFKTWGEMALIGAQCGSQMMMYWVLTTEKINLAPRVAGSIAVGFAYIAICIGGFLPPALLPALGLVQSALGVVARVPQIILNFKQRHTGNQSIITWGLSGCGNAVRILTTLASTKDMVTLGGHGVAFALNFTLVAQILLFWKNTNEVIWGKEAKRKD